MRKIVLIACFIIVIFIGLRFYSAPFLSFKNHRCIGGNSLSDEYCAVISEQIRILDDQKNSVHIAIEKIKKQFPIINEVTIAFQPQQVLIAIKPYEPMCVINDSYVLTVNNELCLKLAFSLAALEKIPVIYVQTEDVRAVTRSLLSIINMLPSHFNNFYDLIFVNSHHVRFVDKKNPQFSILTELDQKNYSILLRQCESIKENFAIRGAFDKSVEWIADGRFAHYIVVYKA